MTVQPFRSDPRSVAKARHFAVQQLGAVSEEVCEQVALLVSELATNCVRHAGTGFKVRVERSRDLVRVEVTDEGGGLPLTRSPAPTDPSGRGLRIVASLASEWGVRPASPPPGKTVWFTLSAKGPRH